jgi:4-amino-4-deoxy-L-arabinose transferase-like glycosyltransferase
MAYDMTIQNPHFVPSRSRDLIILMIALTVIYWSMSWTRPLSNPDEGRYVEIPREMVESGDWVTPRLNGILYFYKPPLFYWLEATAIEVGGLNRMALRFWPAMLALFGVVMTYTAGRALFDRDTGWFAAWMLATCLLYFALGQIILLDMAVTAFMAGGLIAFLIAAHASTPRAKAAWYYGMYALLALAVLSKGLIGLAIPGAIVLIWLVCTGRWSILCEMRLITGTLLFLAIAAPWHILAALQNPASPESEGLLSSNPEGQGFLWYYFTHEHFLRFLDASTSDREQPFWFFLVITPLGFLPWAVFLPQALRESLHGGWQTLRKQNAALLFCLIWIAFVVIFFSLSKSKLIPYILPCYPAVALLIGHFLSRCKREQKTDALRPGLWIYGIAALGVALGLPVAKVIFDDKIIPGVTPWLVIAGIITAVTGLTIIVFLRQRKTVHALGAGIAGLCVFLFIFNPLAAYFQRPSTEAMAAFLKPIVNEDDIVFMYGDYFQDFPVYMERLVHVAPGLPREQQFGYSLEAEKHRHRYLNFKEFITLLQSQVSIYAIARKDHFHDLKRGFADLPLTVLAEDHAFVIFINQPDSETDDTPDHGQ